MKTETQAVADAFKTVSSNASYRGHWIQYSNYAAIIRLECGLQSDHLLSYHLLNKSLSKDQEFKTADDNTFGNGAGTFPDIYKPKKLPDGSNNNRGRILCYFVTDAGKSRPETKNGEYWYETMKPFGLVLVPVSKFWTTVKMRCRCFLAYVQKRYHNQHQHLPRICINSYKLIL
jgi:hypothetical protein